MPNAAQKHVSHATLLHALLSVQGGSQEGYARWELFRRKGLDLYAAHRNNAMKR